MLLHSVMEASEFLSRAFLQAWDFVNLTGMGLVDEARTIVSRLEGLDGFSILIS